MLIDLLKNEISQEDYIRENNIKIVYKKMPKKVYGFIHKYRDINLITINWNISKRLKKKTLIHELSHFELHHLEKEFFEFNIENVEDEADKYIKFLLDNIKEENNNGIF
jgi:Zn-dependent peptidase ImmA (M78 family)